MSCDKKTGRLYHVHLQFGGSTFIFSLLAFSFVFPFVFAIEFVFVFETDEAVAGGGRLYIYNSEDVLFPLENILKEIDMAFVVEGVLLRMNDISVKDIFVTHSIWKNKPKFVTFPDVTTEILKTEDQILDKS